MRSNETVKSKHINCYRKYLRNNLFFPSLQGPWAFVGGMAHGSTSLIKHVSAGTLTSMTNFASSVSRNLDRLSLDQGRKKLIGEVQPTLDDSSPSSSNIESIFGNANVQRLLYY